MRAYPGFEFQELSELLEENEEKKKEFMDTRTNVSQNARLLSSAAFLPSSQVDNVFETGVQTYFKCGWLSEADAVKHFQVQPKVLGMPLYTLHTDGRMVAGCLVSLQELPKSLQNIRRVKIYQSAHLTHAETFVSEALQVRQGQGSDYFSFLRKATQEQQPAAMKWGPGQGPEKLPTFASLKAKVSEIFAEAC